MVQNENPTFRAKSFLVWFYLGRRALAALAVGAWASKRGTELRPSAAVSPVSLLPISPSRTHRRRDSLE